MDRYNKISLYSFLGIVLVFTLLTAFLKNTIPVENSNKVKGIAVIELFTSEGCSSCPPADKAVAAIARDYPGQVYVLGFHVDYWNYLGWKDIYSQSSFTERQRKYSNLFSLNSIYTPQVVVNGKKELVGSKETMIRSIVADELKTTQPVSLTLSGKKVSRNSINFSYTAGADALLNVALVQLQAESDVKRGENSGRNLKHINVVREFKTIPVSNNIAGTTTFDIPGGLSPEAFKVIAYLQDKQTMQVLAAREI